MHVPILPILCSHGSASACDADPLATRQAVLGTLLYGYALGVLNTAMPAVSLSLNFDPTVIGESRTSWDRHSPHECQGITAVDEVAFRAIRWLDRSHAHR